MEGQNRVTEGMGSRELRDRLGRWGKYFSFKNKEILIFQITTKQVPRKAGDGGMADREVLRLSCGTSL